VDRKQHNSPSQAPPTDGLAEAAPGGTKSLSALQSQLPRLVDLAFTAGRAVLRYQAARTVPPRVVRACLDDTQGRQPDQLAGPAPASGRAGVTGYTFPTADYLVLACQDEQRSCQVCGDTTDLIVTAPKIRTLYRCLKHWLPVRWVLEARRYRVRYSPEAAAVLGLASEQATNSRPTPATKSVTG